MVTFGVTSFAFVASLALLPSSRPFSSFAVTGGAVVETGFEEGPSDNGFGSLILSLGVPRTARPSTMINLRGISGVYAFDKIYVLLALNGVAAHF